MAAVAHAAAASEQRDFVHRFALAWDGPSADGLAALLHDRAVLVQPLIRRTTSRQAGREAFAELLRALPDLRGEVRRWAAEGEVVFIELTLSATLAWRRFDWTVADRILLEDGVVRERVSYFDPLPVMLESLKRPWRLPAMLRLMRG